MKFDLEELVVIKENGEVGLVIDREIEDDKLLYVVSYWLNGKSICEQFNENELERNERWENKELITNRKLNVLIAKLEHEKYFVVNHNQTFDKLSRGQQKTIAKKLLEMEKS